MLRHLATLILILLPVALIAAEEQAEAEAEAPAATEGLSDETVAAMREVHGRFKGEAGSFAQLGDSITDTMAFWAPLQWKVKNAGEDYQLVKGYINEGAWRLKGAKNGNQSGKTAAWALKHVDGWLQRLNPEVAVILFGTNDLKRVDTATYQQQLRTLVEKCLANGTVPLLTTIPPRGGMEEKAASFAEAARAIAADLKVPVIDFHKQILERRPEDWNGGGAAFKDEPGGTYQVSTLIARDGVHPSNYKEGRNDFSDDAISKNGYSLRNYLTIQAYADVIRQVLKAE